MRAIGFRAEPKAVHYAVIDVDSDAKVVSDHGKFHPPTTYDEAESLKWYRAHIIQEIEKHQPDSAGIRFPEVFGRKGVTSSDFRRLRIEGVILEAIASAGVSAFGGAMGPISSAIGATSAKAYKERGEVRGMDWSKCNDYCKEAALAALASMGKQ
jgi:hypothetical protein